MNEETRRKIEAVNRTLGRINAMYTQWSAGQGSTYPLMKVLMALTVGGAQTQKRIVDEHAMPKQSVNNVIRELRENGYIQLDPDDGDRRQRLIRLTELGTAYAAQVLQPMFALDARLIARLGIQRHDQLAQALEWYADALEDQLTADAAPTVNRK